MKVQIIGIDCLDIKIQKRVKSLLKKLQKECKLSKDAVLTFKRLKGFHGWSWTSNGKHRIQINSTKKCKTCIVDTLIHEWAHLMCIEKVAHMDEWGINFAKCYRVSIK